MNYRSLVCDISLQTQQSDLCDDGIRSVNAASLHLLMSSNQTRMALIMITTQNQRKEWLCSNDDNVTSFGEHCFGICHFILLMSDGESVGPIRLSADWMSNIPSECVDKDFEFVVNGESIFWNSVLCCALSPKISRLRSGDALSNRFVINTRDEKGLFSQVLALTLGKSLEIRDACDAVFFLSVAEELENRSLCGDILKQRKKDLTVETCIDRLKELYSQGFECDEELEFIASHFCELEREKLKDLDLDLLEQIVFSDCLVLENEDALYEFLDDLFRTNEDKQEACFRLFRALWFECLSVANVQGFCAICGQFLYEMDFTMWDHLSKRLCHDIVASQTESPPKRYNTRKIEYTGSNGLDGIISYLSKACGGNVHDKGVVDITSGPVYGPYAAKNVADLTVKSMFDSEDSANQFVCYNFKDKTIIPTHYSIRSEYQGPIGSFACRSLQSWVVETSSDGNVWTEVDRHEDNRDLIGNYITKTYPISVRNKCRMFRLKQIGPAWDGSNCMVLSALEVFGTIHEGPQPVH